MDVFDTKYNSNNINALVIVTDYQVTNMIEGSQQHSSRRQQQHKAARLQTHTIEYQIKQSVSNN